MMLGAVGWKQEMSHDNGDCHLTPRQATASMMASAITWHVTQLPLFVYPRGVENHSGKEHLMMRGSARPSSAEKPGSIATHHDGGDEQDDHVK